MYKLRAKVKARNASDEFAVWASPSSGGTPALDAALCAMPDPRTAHLGTRAIVPREAVSDDVGRRDESEQSPSTAHLGTRAIVPCEAASDGRIDEREQNPSFLGCVRVGRASSPRGALTNASSHRLRLFLGVAEG